MTVVRIPLRSAKHHFGVSLSRGTRPYNEDTYQAGVIELPAFAQRSPLSLTRSSAGAHSREGTSAESASGDSQVFYFGVFDGHGGNECSDFLREELHTYIEDTAKQFGLQSSLKRASKGVGSDISSPSDVKSCRESEDSKLPPPGTESTNADNTPGKDVGTPARADCDKHPSVAKDNQIMPRASGSTLLQDSNKQKVEELQRSLVLRWKDLVGGYFRRFKPQYFSITGGGQRVVHEEEVARQRQIPGTQQTPGDEVTIEAVMTYAFLKADLDFVAAQAGKKDEDAVQAERPLNEGDILGQPNRSRGQIGGPKRFKGGSTCSVAMISTPSLTPFWHPASSSTILTSHVGDTRILISSTASGQAMPLTTNHHPSSPVEGARLRRYAASFVTDSFGEERMSGLANTRAFGDMQSKRLGVSAEPEIRRLELGPAEYSFLVLLSDGVSGTLNDQEVVDIVKEARTPEQGAKDVVSFATEVSTEGDNSTCLVIRLGGWERRSEGGLGSMGTKESRDWRRQDATDPRSRRT
ncbi:MAG: hypothetical protein M1830_004596 [Pleopsidium flavum]|nr:MAG: hypothetical protein M1830_004596 [Pleopsidium flavum]